MIGSDREPRHLSRASLAMVAFAMSFAGSPALADTSADNAVCAAIRDLGLAAIAGGAPQRIGFGRLGPDRAGCGPTDTPAREEFCRVMVENVGLRAPQRFPWMVYDCLGMSRDAHR